MAMASAEHCCHNPHTRSWCLHCVGELEAEIARLRAALERFAESSSWTKPAANVNQHWDIWADDDCPAEFARKTLEAKP